ncbi:arylsulfatase [Pontiella sp.]|uniref:sulfatase family protein n=1 Tax=Pontiella sp. TaxID=2837462 RepID=UPI003567C3F7
MFALLIAFSGLLNGWAERAPNVVIIYGDDVGYGDVGAYGSTMIPTPNIDRLATEGLRFIDGHCTAGTCSPSRFSMLSGIHAFRHDVGILPPNAPLTIPTDALTLPKLFQTAGYATAVIGKWHLGLGKEGVPTDWNGEVKPGPLEIGFNSSFLLPSTNDRVPCVYLAGHRVLNLDPSDPLFVGASPRAVNRPGSTAYPDAMVNPQAMTKVWCKGEQHRNSVINGIGRIGYMAGGKSALWNDEEMADVFVKQAKAYIAGNRDQPFFLYFSSQDIHAPRTPHPRFQGKTKLSARGDAMVQFDWSTGQIMQALDAHGLAENTIVIFSSDNGPVYQDAYDDGSGHRRDIGEVDRGHDASGIWRDGKYSVYEGGTRVPLIIRWPARIRPGVSDAMVNQIDFIASFAALLKVPLPQGEARDSRNTLAAFLGQDAAGHEFMIEENGRRIALRQRNWKLIAQRKKGPSTGFDPVELYDLASDPGERENLIQRHPERVESMNAKLNEMRRSSGIRK